MNPKFILLLSLISLLSISVFAQKNTYSAWINKSAEYIETNQLDSAMTALLHAMKQDPDNPKNPQLLFNLGVLQRQLNLYEDAYISFTASLLGNPDVLLVLHNRASLLCDLNRFEEALDDYNLIIQKDAGNIEAYYRRGLLFLEKNERVNAENDFRACENIDPNNLFTKLGLALLFKLSDKWKEAERIYSNIIKVESIVFPLYYLNRAECYMNINQFNKAAADLRVIERDERNNPYFYILRGRLRLEQFDKFAAKADFVKAKELGYDPEIANEWIKKTQ